MIRRCMLFILMVWCEVVSKNSLAAPITASIHLPYDYEVDWKCQRGTIEGRVCDGLSYRDVRAIDGNLHNDLLSISKKLRPTEPPEDTAFGFLGTVGSAQVIIGMDTPQNVATYIIFTLVNGKLVDHQLIGEDDMEENSIKRDFLIDKNYRISVYSRKPKMGIKSPRKLIAQYQIQPDGKIAALK